MSSLLCVVFVRLEVCRDARRIIPGAEGIAVMSNPQNTAELSPEDCYLVLSGLHLQILRRYASFFCALPSTDRRKKHDLVCWILQSSSYAVLGQLLTFVTNARAEHSSKHLRTEGSSNDNDSGTLGGSEATTFHLRPRRAFRTFRPLKALDCGPQTLYSFSASALPA